MNVPRGRGRFAVFRANGLRECDCIPLAFNCNASEFPRIEKSPAETKESDHGLLMGLTTHQANRCTHGGGKGDGGEKLKQAGGQAGRQAINRHDRPIGAHTRLPCFKNKTYASLKPLTCSILICLTIVLLPDSPAPEIKIVGR